MRERMYKTVAVPFLETSCKKRFYQGKKDIPVYITREQLFNGEKPKKLRQNFHQWILVVARAQLKFSKSIDEMFAF